MSLNRRDVLKIGAVVAVVAFRRGRLRTLATSRMLCPLRRLTVSANCRLGVRSERRKVEAKPMMLLAAAPRQP